MLLKFVNWWTRVTPWPYWVNHILITVLLSFIHPALGIGFYAGREFQQSWVEGQSAEQGVKDFLPAFVAGVLMWIIRGL